MRRGVALIVNTLILITISLYLASTTVRAIYENKNLERDKSLFFAHYAALAGMEQAFLMLEDDFKSSGSWSDGDISGVSITPDSSDKDAQYTLINETTLDNNAKFEVKIQFIFDAGNNAYKGRLWVYSTGKYEIRPGETIETTLRRLATASQVYNVNQNKYYPDLASAINDANPGDTLRVAKGTLSDNITINKNLTIELGYDYDFTHRDPFVHQTIITPLNSSSPTLTITAGDINLGGGKVE